MPEEKCSVPGCGAPAAFEARVRDRGGKMSEQPRPYRRFLCVTHLLFDEDKECFYHRIG